MIAAWVWWCAVCAACACGVRGAAVDADIIALLLDGTDVISDTENYRVSGELAIELLDDPPSNFADSQDNAVMLVVGGMNGYNAISDVEVLHLGLGQWRTVAPLPSPRFGSGLAVLDGKVYSVGGYGTGQHGCTNSVYVYDVAADTWTTGPPLSECRWSHGVAVIGSTIYAVGGYGENSFLSSAEALDAGATEWRPIASMFKHNPWPRVAALDGKLYAVGGGRGDPLTVERYDPVRDAWESVPEMIVQQRDQFSVGVVDGALYVVGGSMWTSPALSSLVRYRPAADGPGEWSEVPPMHTSRQEPAVTTHRGRLYVVGGDNGTSELNTVEVFDPATQMWMLLDATMSVGRRFASAVVVENVTT